MLIYVNITEGRTETYQKYSSEPHKTKAGHQTERLRYSIYWKSITINFLRDF